MSEIPYGYCHCGCGRKTNLCRDNDPQRKYVKDEPHKFLAGHHDPNSCGSNHANWKGGKIKTGTGYTIEFCPDHPKANARGYVYEHILIAEKALGKLLPEKAVVHHHTPEQLVVCQDQAYHMLIELKTRAYDACGHANWRKCNICKQYDKPENLYIHPNFVLHRECENARARAKTKAIHDKRD